MTIYQKVLSVVLTIVWVTLYMAAAFYDPTLTGLAMSVTPVLLIPVGFIFGKDAIGLFKKRERSSDD